MATISFTSTATTITCTVNGLDGTYSGGRLYKYYRDGSLIHTETESETETSHSYTYTGLEWKTKYAIKVQVYSIDGATLFAELSGNPLTSYASISQFSWTASTDRSNAYTAVTEQGYVGSFKYTVWNEIVSKVAEALTATGQEWDDTYATQSGTQVSSSDKNLYAAKFNSAVANVKYPYWSWEKDNQNPHYIGRLAVRGVSAVGRYYADYVYGDYITELVKNLNTMIERYTHTGTYADAEANTSVTVTTRANLIATIIAYMQANMDVFVSDDATLMQANAADLEAVLNAETSATADLGVCQAVTAKAAHFAQIYYSANLIDYISAEMEALQSVTFTPVAEVVQCVAEMLSTTASMTLSTSADLSQCPAIQCEANALVSMSPSADMKLASAIKASADTNFVQTSTATMSLLERTIYLTVTPYLTQYKHIASNYSANSFSKVTVNAISKVEADNTYGKTVTLGDIAPDSPTGTGERPYTANAYTTTEVYIPSDVSSYSTFDMFTVNAISRTEEDNTGGGKTVTIGSVKGD